MSNDSIPQTGVAAGVPFVAVPPDGVAPAGAPAVFAWHLMDPPRTEQAFATALPMTGLPAWRIYLGLPMSGSRMPEGGPDELQRLGYEDAIANLHGPIAIDGADEFPAAYAELRNVLGFGDGPIGVVGASNGSALAQLVIAEVAPRAGIEIAAAVLISPVTVLASTVEALATRFGFTYQWSEATRTIADRLDFVSRAGAIAETQPAIRLVVGSEDDPAGIIQPARRLEQALQARYADGGRVDLVEVAGMGHALADEPGIEPAPQTADAAQVDRQTVEWLQRYLIAR